jgi:hypothetical protein
VGALVELLCGMGVLAEAVGAAPTQTASHYSRGGRGFGGRSSRGSASMRRRSAAGSSSTDSLQAQPEQPPAGSLAAIGYAPAFGGGTAGSMPAVSMWVQRAGWCGSDGKLAAMPAISLHHIQQVVSARIVSSAAQQRSVLGFAAEATGLAGLAQGRAPFAMPTQVVACPADAGWAAWPGRYLVSRKCDGTRCLLLVAQDGAAYLLNRAGTLYKYPVSIGSISGGSRDGSSTASGGGSSGGGCQGSSGGGCTTGLPPGTCLDGELVWMGPPGAAPATRRGLFLAFDVLSVGHQPCWQLLLGERLGCLQRLGLPEAESCSALLAAASGSGAAVGRDVTAGGAAAVSSTAVLAKKQQAPCCGSDSITLLAKRHLAVSAAVLEELEDSRAACPYPTDGLVFTAAGFPYLLGMPQLLLKWQPAEQAAADISGADLQAAAKKLRWELPPGHNTQISNLPASLIYECQQLHPPA